MIAILIGIYFFITSLIFGFAFVLCKSAAMADKAYERARLSDQKTWSTTPEWIESYKKLGKSPDTRPRPGFRQIS